MLIANTIKGGYRSSHDPTKSACLHQLEQNMESNNMVCNMSYRPHFPFSNILQFQKRETTPDWQTRIWSKNDLISINMFTIDSPLPQAYPFWGLFVHWADQHGNYRDARYQVSLSLILSREGLFLDHLCFLPRISAARNVRGQNIYLGKDKGWSFCFC